ncbi:hypothetical protein [Thalassoroseus pseudoceratinae]|uniref:hypothetical protein n=1 Tax=Thalassoroseus pseudoceratinae TaxID=2713176 RepID=UPI00142290C9|nr:hypothetical protein [Thalassoroseus pseudoceratinae]
MTLRTLTELPPIVSATMATPTPQPSPKDGDATMIDSIACVVHQRTNGGVRDLRVDMTSGGLVLTGRTNTYYTKQLATHAALDVVDPQSESGSARVALTNAIEVC